MKKSAPHEPKKQPKQDRSRATVDYILKAAAQLLDQDGAYYGLNTNRIAKKAGVAVASLYQYFPNKEAIVNALFEMELSEERAELTTKSTALQDAPIKEVSRSCRPFRSSAAPRRSSVRGSRSSTWWSRP